jgi:quinoprotein glucose dehydrogenase
MIAKILTGICSAGAVAFALTSTAAHAQEQDRWWPDYGGGIANSHYYDGDRITPSNVDQLEIAWTYPTRDNGGYQFNPLVVNGVMYVLARNHSLVALDVRTGEEIWIHEGLPNITRRGITYWESDDGTDRRLIFTLDNTIQQVDAATGESIISFGNNGYVDLRAGLRREHHEIYNIQSRTPGKVFEDLLILGSTTGEGFLSPPGDIRAFDVLTGELVWQFHTISHPGEFGYETWPPGAWQYAGAANVWGEITIDAERGIAYFPVGSATYDFYGADRHGKNLFANTLLALDARTGERLWHFQHVHHDLWDYDPTSAPQLVTVRRNGRTIDAVAQATKQGYLYVFDRMTGEPVFPIEERPMPQSTVPGEETWPTQPIPDLPPFGRLTFTVEDINPYLPEEERAQITETVRNAVNEGYYTPPALGRPSVQMPGNRGGSNWGTTSAHPSEGLVYVMNSDAPALLELNPRPERRDPGVYGGGEVYEMYCMACHGEGGEGGGAVPSLTDVMDRLGAEQVQHVILNGQGQMPGFALEDDEFEALLDFLSDLDGGDDEGVPVAEAAEQPERLGGPVVASGGAPAAREFLETMPRGRPPGWSYHEGPPYPAALDTPSERYYSDYNVRQNIISPPWSTMVAYDLNEGTIKWQIPIGEEPEMVARGIRNTGLRGDQRAPIVTSTGLLLVATGDGYFRAIDAEDGAERWKTKLPGTPGIFPSVYELDGQPYIVVPAARGAQEGGEPSYVVFTLPE